MTYPVALYLQDAHDIRHGIELAQYAEAKGFDAVWQADSRLVRDAVVPMAAFAANTDRIKIGSGVLDIWTRNAARLASTFSTLDDLAPGRIICGLGAWWDPLASKVGIDRARPLKVMREVVDATRGLLANETVTVDGYHVHLDGVELDYVYQERRAKDVPIYIGATGMQMMELTGEIADGAVLNYLVSPSYNIGALEALARGAAKVGRTLDDIDRPQLVVCSVDDDRQAALDAARLLVTQYLGQQPHIMKASGVPQELLDQMAGPFLPARNRLQLLTPHSGVGVGQCVVGLRAYPRQRRAQLMCHIACKLPLGGDAVVKPGQQGIYRCAQLFNIARAGRCSD